MSKAVEVMESVMSETLGLNYEYMTWTDDVVYPYWVGEYQEVPNSNEDGMKETSFILNGFTRGLNEELETEKAKIEALFGQIGGHKVTTDIGSVVAIFYENAMPVRTGDAELKRLQIILKIKEWSVI